MIWLQSINRSAGSLLGGKEQTAVVSPNKESAPEESHYRGRQKAAKNNPNLEIKISAHKVTLSILICSSSH